MRVSPVAILTLLLVAAALAAAVAWAGGSTAVPPPTPAAHEAEIARVLLLKSERRLALIDREGVERRTYQVALGGQPVGHKQREGDGRTPEGTYVLDWRNPKSAYHLSLHVSYPDVRDRRAASRRGDDPGGMIMIHGLPNGLGWLGSAHLRVDWTDGCIAVTDAQIEEIWRMVPNGTPIEIRP
ncbi:L,D-transpeptidase family protein [Stappia sp.]|uniref:L,D-transpeptidase family protein n=1 Tax=Stappia sp. TaxID=1870903 RepID=UPI003A992C1F